MNQMSDTSRIKPITSKITNMEPLHLDEEILERVIGLVRLGIGILNSLILTRYMLKLMGANPANPFAELIYSTTQPLLSVFQGLIRVVTVNGIVFELHDLIAIAVYAMLGWSVIQLIRIMFVRVR